MTLIGIKFDGYIDIDKNSLALFTEYGESADTISLTAEQIVAGLKSGTYSIDFSVCHKNAIRGDESYDFFINK